MVIIGIEATFSQLHSFSAEDLRNGGTFCVHFDGILGKGKQSIVYRVAKCSHAFVKCYRAEDSKAFDSELKCLRELQTVSGVPKLLGCERTPTYNNLLCGIVGKKLINLDLLGNLFTVCELGNVLVDVLYNVHSHHILHRDISPHNIFVIMDEKTNFPAKVFLGDFGCAITDQKVNTVYEGTVTTAANDVLEKICNNRKSAFRFTAAMDLESLMKTLWMMVSVECKDVIARNGNKHDYGAILETWSLIERTGKNSPAFFSQWLISARNGNYNDLQKQLTFNGPHFNAIKHPTQSFLRRTWQKTIGTIGSVQRRLQSLSLESTPPTIEAATLPLNSFDELRVLQQHDVKGFGNKMKRQRIEEEEEAPVEITIEEVVSFPIPAAASPPGTAAQVEIQKHDNVKINPSHPTG